MSLSKTVFEEPHCPNLCLWLISLATILQHLQRGPWNGKQRQTAIHADRKFREYHHRKVFRILEVWEVNAQLTSTFNLIARSAECTRHNNTLSVTTRNCTPAQSTVGSLSAVKKPSSGSA